MKDEVTDFFWQQAEPLLAAADVTRGTMMGFPCLRVGKDFFASAEHRTGDLIVKLPRERVDELIGSPVEADYSSVSLETPEDELLREDPEELAAEIARLAESRAVGDDSN